MVSSKVYRRTREDSAADIRKRHGVALGDPSDSLQALVDVRIHGVKCKHRLDLSLKQRPRQLLLQHREGVSPLYYAV